jgi:MFS family permease
MALYLEPVMADLGIDRVATSSLYAAATLAAAACLPFIGSIADRVSSGRFLGGVLALIAVSMIGFSQARTVVALAISFFLLRMLAQGAIGLGTITATVRWFRVYRGRALAMVGLGYAFGQLVYPALVFWLIEGLGWRASLIAMGVVYLLIAAPLIGWLSREPREEDGPLDGGAAPARAANGGSHHPEPTFTLREAAAFPVFWGLLLCVAVPPLVYTAVIFHQVAIFAGQGWEATLVPLALTVMASATVFASFVTGLLLERYPSRFGVGAALALCGVGMIPLLLPLQPLVGAVVYGVVFGLGSGANASANAIIWPDYFGVAALGALKGVVTAVRNGSTALGPPIAAVLAATSGSFSSSIVFFIILSLASAALSMAMVRPAEHVASGGRSGLRRLGRRRAA